VTALGSRCKRLPDPSSIYSTRQAKPFLVEAGAVAVEEVGAAAPASAGAVVDLAEAEVAEVAAEAEAAAVASANPSVAGP
jgi:hypothetical protein